MATSVTKNAISWTFAADYVVGQYVNGDYYVVDPGSGVTINSVTQPAATVGEDGSMIDPPINVQAYDDDAPAYDAAELVSYPVTITGDKSLVSTISVQASDLDVDGKYLAHWYPNPFEISKRKVRDLEVLTIVSSAPPASSFRPPYNGTYKPNFTRSQVNENWLTNHPSPTGLIGSFWDVAQMEISTQRPWVHHPSTEDSRHVQPLENMFNYHRDIGDLLSRASLAMLTVDRTETLLVNYIQVGIDFFGALNLEVGTSNFASSSMWKWPIIFSGLLLEEAEMYQFFCLNTTNTDPRTQEKWYYAKDGSSSNLSSVVLGNDVKPFEQTWTGSRVAMRKQVGNVEHEHLHPSEWGVVSQGGGITQEGYRNYIDSVPSLGMVFSAIIVSRDSGRPALTAGSGDASHADTPLKLWFKNGGTFGGADDEQYPAFDYAIRWMEEPFNTTYKPTIETYYGAQPDYGETTTIGWIDEMYTDYVYPEVDTAFITSDSDYRLTGAQAPSPPPDSTMTNPDLTTTKVQAALDSIKADCDTLNALGVGTSTITASDLTTQDNEAGIAVQYQNQVNLKTDNSLGLTLTVPSGDFEDQFQDLYDNLVAIEAALS